MRVITEIPFYVFQLSKSAEQLIVKKYGKKQISKNIINMFNKHLIYRMNRQRPIYDYEVISSQFYKGEIKDPKINVTELLNMFMEVRVFNDGTTYRKNPKTNKGEGKHYRFKAEFIKEHGFAVKKIYRDIKPAEVYVPSYVEDQTDKFIARVELTTKDLLLMPRSSVENVFRDASSDRFKRKISVQLDKVSCFHKRFDYELSYDLEDHQLFKKWETKRGAYDMYNSLVNFEHNLGKAKTSPTNYRLHHKLLELPKECLRFMRVEGEPLAELDLKNSQPCLLMNILFGKLKIPYKSYDIVLEKVESDHCELKNQISIDSKLAKLIEASYNGSFYTVLKSLSEEEISRDEAKKATMNILFSGFNSKWNPAQDIWKENYEELFYFIRNVKRAYYIAHKDDKLDQKDKLCKSGEIDSYKASTGFLPILLQRAESIIFVENILTNLFKQDIFALSKHDAILCKVSDMEKVRGIMEDSLDDLLGKHKYALEEGYLFEECQQLAA